ncbi:MAG: 3-phosphoshikimate 1-carboxyvinyltransferase [Desulfobacterales bacterium]|nr:3-phosphoshikimate 1-carboxyvinyltransferase [Desulfobacterales bacterium]
MIEIIPTKIKDCDISVPGSKSYTHRIIIAAALSDGVCKINNDLRSEDTVFTGSALEQMGIKMEQHLDYVIVHGASGKFKPCSEPVYLGNSGTSMRLMTGVAALGEGLYTLTGTERMHQRPIVDLIDSLSRLGVCAKAVNDGCPPVEIKGRNIKGGSVPIKCDISSQFLSSLLLIAPYTRKGLEITVTAGPVSKPYIDMTIDVMEKFGVKVKRDGYEFFKVQGGQIYKSGEYNVEPDLSQASYFWAAGAITGAKVKVKGVKKNSIQGDLRLTDVFAAMGCKVSYENDGISVAGGNLEGIEVDMSDMPDMVPTLAVVAAFAKGTTEIKNVAHLKAKESDRLGAVANELTKMGIAVSSSDSGLIIQGGQPKGVSINTYNDHRIAMSFAIAGLSTPGVLIQNEKCVDKSFPNFWEVFQGFYK